MRGKINFVKLKVPLLGNLPPCKPLNANCRSELDHSLVSVIEAL